MKKICLDTNAYSALLRGDPQIRQALEEAEAVLVPSICIGELLAGFRLGSRNDENRKLLDLFLSKSTVSIASVTKETADLFAEVFVSLKKNGNPIPINDVWIAALALEHGAVLASYDQHFQQISGLRVWPAVEI
jgi:tRNA(fMet)-specific endonuclease VapC